jgi:hypothetical protein
VVLTVSVPGVPVEAEAAPQVGPEVTTGEILQLSVTLPLKPFAGVTVTVEVAEPPGLTVAGESAVADSVKDAELDVDGEYVTTKASAPPPLVP